MSLRTDLIERYAARLDKEGWTCDGHEPGGICSDCRKVQLSTATRLVDDGLDLLTERADEWWTASKLTPEGPPVEQRLLAVLRNGRTDADS